MVRHIILEEHLVNKAREFSEKVVRTVNYSDSNQYNVNKIKKDHFIGKLGEEAVKKILEPLGYKIDGPDYTIYKGRNKSWADDLYINGIGIAVKTQDRESANLYGLSWTFADSLTRRDTILDRPDAIVFFVEVVNNCECNVYPPRKIKDLQFRDPIKSYLKGKKKVVYAEDINSR